MKWLARCSGVGRPPWSIRRDGKDDFLVANFDGFFSRRLTLRQIPGPTIAVLDRAFFRLRAHFEIGLRDGSRWQYIHHAEPELTGRLSGPGDPYEIIQHADLHASIRHNGRQVAAIEENCLQWGHETVLDVTSDDEVDPDRFTALLGCYLASGALYRSRHGFFSINLGRLMPGKPPRDLQWKPRLRNPAPKPGPADGPR